MTHTPGTLHARVTAFADWRDRLAATVRRYRQWLDDNSLADAGLVQRLDRISQRLREERMSVAFVAEFSRGKSELINALFFSGYGRRILPSSAGRTTMCPTELMYDPARVPSIRLLPIETRLEAMPLADLRHDVSRWTEIEIDAQDVESVSRGFAAVRETQRVSAEVATELGLYDAQDEDSPVQADEDGQVEVPRWRHAIVNIPDPLLEKGLVIIDTPGLNAIGNEPELTLNLIPSANAVLFVLAADAGVSRSDIEIWRESISTTHQGGRYVVLNKIDGLWDELRTGDEIDGEIQRQVDNVAHTLDLPAERIFPVSAQKALVAKVQGDAALLERTRLARLEQALSTELIPQQHQILTDQVEADFGELHRICNTVLQSRRRHAVEQLFELNSLRGKNRSVVDVMANRIKGEREEFEKSLRHLQGLRTVFARQSQAICLTMSMESLKRHLRVARDLMGGSNFSLGLREGMGSLLTGARTDFDELERQGSEIGTMMVAMYKTFNAEHGFALGTPMLFSVRRYRSELDVVESLYRGQFGALRLVTTERHALIKRFFESVVARVREIYEAAIRDLEIWLRAVMAPIEGQVREHQVQMRRRLDSVRRVLDASGTLEERIAEIESIRDQAEQQISVIAELAGEVKLVMGSDLPEGEAVALAAPSAQGEAGAPAEVDEAGQPGTGPAFVASEADLDAELQRFESAARNDSPDAEAGSEGEAAAPQVVAEADAGANADTATPGDAADADQARALEA